MRTECTRAECAPTLPSPGGRGFCCDSRRGRVGIGFCSISRRGMVEEGVLLPLGEGGDEGNQLTNSPHLNLLPDGEGTYSADP